MKEFFKKYKWFLAAGVLAAAVLAVAFFSGGNVEKARQQAQQTLAVATADSTAPVTAYTTAPSVGDSTAPPATAPAATRGAQPSTAPKPTAAPAATAPAATKSVSIAPAKPEPKPTTAPKPTAAPVSTEAPGCTVSVSCATVFDNLDRLDDGIAQALPADGWILPPSKVTLQDGDTAFSVLQRVCRERNIPMEFSFTPMYDSDYVEGIGNLYEFDCGANSGWMYCVNGMFPSVGSSAVTLQSGDTVEWRYTCNLGYDVGGGR